MRSDVVMQSIVSDVFWLLVLVAIIFSFRNEISALLNSFGRFKVAGASFELKDSRTTIENYVVLTNIMIDILSDHDSSQKLGDLMTSTNVRLLGKFAIQYSRDVPNDIKQAQMLKNIALIVGRRGDIDSAKLFFDALLKNNPRDLDILNMRANILVGTGSQVNLLEAEFAYDELVKQRPKDGTFRFSRALAKAGLGKEQECIDDLSKAIDLHYWKKNPDMLHATEFDSLREDLHFLDLNRRLEGLKKSQA